MKLLFALAVLILVAVLGSRLTFLNRRLSLGFRNILLTGTEYIFIGALLGGMGLNILDEGARAGMQPFLVIGLCWIGFMFGLQFQVRRLKILPSYYFAISAVQATLTFLCVSLVSFFLLQHFVAAPLPLLIMLAITLGSSSSCTAQSALAIVSQNYKFKNRRLMDLMQYISGIDGFYALCFFGAAMCIFPAGDLSNYNFNIIASLEWILVTLLMGILPALIFISLLRARFSQQEFFVFLVGTVIFCGGIAFQVHFSPLLSGLVCGVFTANFSRHYHRALSEIIQAEKSIYIILLLLLGACWDLKTGFVLVVTGAYIIARILGKLFGTFLGTRIFRTGFPVPAGLGLGLMSEGGHAVAIILSFDLVFPGTADYLVTIVILSVIFNELISPWFILAQFDKKNWTLVNIRQQISEKREQVESAKISPGSTSTKEDKNQERSRCHGA